jgi:AcrR family transcriptional regulator
MPSLSSNAARPTPQQERAARTHALFLDTAEALFVEVGYEAATMTAVAERAGASIGALYRWFPDKAALATALMGRYTKELEEHWAPVFAMVERVPTAEFASMMIGTVMDFCRARPAFFVLREAPIQRTRKAGARRNLRETLARAFRARRPNFSEERAYLIANVVVDTIKGLLGGAAAVGVGEREALTVEFTAMLSLYLTSVFD